MIFSNVLTFGKFSVSRKPIINGGAIRPVGLLFSFLACSFLRMVPMHSKNMDLVESSKGHFERSERSNLAPFLLGGNFLKNCLITFSLFMQEASQAGY